MKVPVDYAGTVPREASSIRHLFQNTSLSIQHPVGDTDGELKGLYMAFG